MRVNERVHVFSEAGWPFFFFLRSTIKAGERGCNKLAMLTQIFNEHLLRVSTKQGPGQAGLKRPKCEGIGAGRKADRKPGMPWLSEGPTL